MITQLIKRISILALTIGIIVFPSQAQALIPFEGSGSLGSFSGSLNYTPTDSTSATLEIYLENTSPDANGGYITAFVFNNPSDLITGASLSSTDSDFELIGGPTFQGGINGSPNGQFDIGASTGGSYEGGGVPQPGIAVGDDETFTFTLTGSGLDALSDNSFATALSTGTGEGEGAEAFTARFKGFEDDGSDKVAGDFDGNGDGNVNAVIPEPGTMLLFAAGLVAVFLRRKTV